MASEPSSVLFVTPRWARDGGVGAHVKASAAALAGHGVQVHVLVARVEDDAHIDGVTVHQSAELFHSEAPIGVRLGDVLSCEPDLVHLHQMDDPEVAIKALTASGLDAAKLFARAQQGDVKAKLIENTQSAVERGAFGSPTFFVGKEMFFGKEQLREVEELVSGQ